MTRWFWGQTGGLLIEEFLVVEGSRDRGSRRLDGLIVLGEPKTHKLSIEFDIRDRDVIAVQTKARRLGMSLAGQCLISRDLVRSLGPKSVRSIALCTADDSALRPLLEQHEGCEVIVFPGETKGLKDLSH